MSDKPFFRVDLSSIHQRGLFATCDISSGTEIIQYTGEKISKEESARRGLEWEEKARENNECMVYIFELNEDWDIDGRTDENLARYMNHSCDSNCEAVNYGNEIWIVARRDISEGEELVFDYGYDMKHFLDHPCNCGADNCIGYIVCRDQHTKVRKLLKNKKRHSPD